MFHLSRFAPEGKYSRPFALKRSCLKVSKALQTNCSAKHVPKVAKSAKQCLKKYIQKVTKVTNSDKKCQNIQKVPKSDTQNQTSDNKLQVRRIPGETATHAIYLCAFGTAGGLTGAPPYNTLSRVLAPQECLRPMFLQHLYIYIYIYIYIYHKRLYILYIRR